MKINMPKNVESAINKLIENGFCAYIVGGCVRDSLLGLSPYDWDIATSATPEEMIRVFKNSKVIETGIKHGTLTVIIDSSPLEITTLRIDGEYKDNRHPVDVSYTSDLSKDLSRRDFTINAMAYNRNEGLIDCFSGIDDLNRKLIRCVGEPDRRFNEDALRILRGLRFSSTLGFEIEEKTGQSILMNKDLLKNISVERIQKELIKLLCGKNVEEVLLNYNNVIFTIIKELEPLYKLKQENKYHNLNVWEHTVRSVSSIPPVAELRMAMLLHDIGKAPCTTTDKNGVSHFYGHPKVSVDISDKVLHSLRFPKKFIENVLTLIEYHDARIYENPKQFKRLLGRLGDKRFRQLLLVMRADITAQSPELIERLKLVDAAEKRLDEIINSKSCLNLSDLAVNGNDIVNVGVSQGKKVGKVLEYLLNEVLESKVDNDKEKLLEYLKNYIK
ncbi:MAG TPA: HD domain-containing protein [Clostridia bacterium]|nr:HD domain-containing protein [Clostridia bacterium]